MRARLAARLQRNVAIVLVYGLTVLLFIGSSIAVSGFRLAVGGGAAVEPLGVVDPHAVNVMTAAAASVASRTQAPGLASAIFILPYLS